jgi:hypothetical protein
MKSQKAGALRLGAMVFGGLLVLTVLEYWFAAMAQGPIPYPVLFAPLAPITWLALVVSANSAPFLAVVAVLKALLILRFFMHVTQIWRSEGGH